VLHLADDRRAGWLVAARQSRKAEGGGAGAMTPKFYAWLAHLANRDATLGKLALFSIGLVVAWELLRFVPPTWAMRLRPAYMIGVLVIFFGTAALIYFGVQP